MNKSFRKLPDAEFDVMRVVWANTPPIHTGVVMEQLGVKKGWKLQTVITLLLRLCNRGFLRTEKNGKERTFFPLIDEEEYLQFETGSFMERFHNNSFLSLVSTLYDGNRLDESDLQELRAWLNKRGG